MRLAFLCDFDGTASPSDIGAAFARRFSPDGAAEAPAFLARWKRGEMGHRELTEAQCALLAVTREEAIAFARPYAVDPHFAPFVREAGSRGDAVSVVSEGFDFYVRDLLERAGLAELPWSANVLRFEDGRVRPEFPNADGCGRCGNCKGTHVRAWRARGYRVVLVVPEKFVGPKTHVMSVLGAEIVLTPTEKGMPFAIDKARELARTLPNAYLPQQFENEANPDYHYATTAPEVHAQRAPGRAVRAHRVARACSTLECDT